MLYKWSVLFKMNTVIVYQWEDILDYNSYYNNLLYNHIIIIVK